MDNAVETIQGMKAKLQKALGGEEYIGGDILHTIGLTNGMSANIKFNDATIKGINVAQRFLAEENIAGATVFLNRAISMSYEDPLSASNMCANGDVIVTETGIQFCDNDTKGAVQKSKEVAVTLYNPRLEAVDRWSGEDILNHYSDGNSPYMTQATLESIMDSIKSIISSGNGVGYDDVDKLFSDITAIPPEYFEESTSPGMPFMSIADYFNVEQTLSKESSVHTLGQALFWKCVDAGVPPEDVNSFIDSAICIGNKVEGNNSSPITINSTSGKHGISAADLTSLFEVTINSISSPSEELECENTLGMGA